jgi:hypothetical protein
VLDPYPRLMSAAWRVGVVMAVAFLPLATWLRGLRGLGTAGGVLGLVVGGFVATAMALRWAGRRGPTSVQAVALGSVVLKLSLYALLLVTLAPLGVVDRPTLAITAPVSVVVLLVIEVRLVVTHPEFRMIHSTPAWARDGKDRV